MNNKKEYIELVSRLFFCSFLVNSYVKLPVAKLISIRVELGISANISTKFYRSISACKNQIQCL
jgi:hypothetical protein